MEECGNIRWEKRWVSFGHSSTCSQETSNLTFYLIVSSLSRQWLYHSGAPHPLNPLPCISTTQHPHYGVQFSPISHSKMIHFLLHQVQYSRPFKLHLPLRKTSWFDSINLFFWNWLVLSSYHFSSAALAVTLCLNSSRTICGPLLLKWYFLARSLVIPSRNSTRNYHF